MKNFFKIIVLAAVLCLVASCENSIGKKTIDENDGDKTDTATPDDDADHGDTEVPDDTDTDVPDTATDDDEDVVDTTDTDTPAVYNTPYGSLTLKFDNMIGGEGEPSFSSEVFATGTYGNSTASVIPEYTDKIETVTVLENDNIHIQQTPIYADESYGNPVIEFFIPVDQANVGFYDINYNATVSLIISEIDWNTRDTVCYHAFGEGQIEISEVNVNYAITLSGNATLYNPKNYKWNDVTDAFLEKFSKTNVICDPVD